MNSYRKQVDMGKSPQQKGKVMENTRKTVWILYCGWDEYEMGESDHSISVYETYESAKKEFDRIVELDKEHFRELGYFGSQDPDNDWAWDETDTRWDIWQPGYGEHFSTIYIEKKDVR